MQSKRRFALLGAWYAAHRQKKRRSGGAQVLPVPTLFNGLAVWEGTSAGMWDVSFGWAIELGSYPEDSIEIEQSINGQAGMMVGDMPVGDGGFYLGEVTGNNGDWARYRARYHYNPGSGQVYGDWSPWLAVKCFFPPLPVLFLGGQFWDQTVPGYADVSLGWTFDHADLPAGLFDVQSAPGPDGTDWEDIGTVGSGERGFFHACAYSGQSGLTYRVRYRNDGVTGEWSAGFNVDFDD